MSDLDDLLDDMDKGELVKPSKPTPYARQASYKSESIPFSAEIYRSNPRDEENRVNSRNDLEFLEEIMEQYGDNDAGGFEANEPEDAEQPGSLTNLRSGKSTKKKVDRSTKLKDKMGKMLKEKKTGIDKNKFTMMMTSDPFSKPKPEAKPEPKIEKPEIVLKESKSQPEEYKEKSVAPKQAEVRESTSLNSLDVPGKVAQETGTGSRVLSQKPEDNISSIHELEKSGVGDSGMNTSSMPFVDSEKDLTDGLKNEVNRQDSSRYEDSLGTTQNQVLQEGYDSTQPNSRRKKDDNSFQEDDANDRYQKINNNKLELDVLQSKPMSILKEQTPYDIFVPGNQKIIKSYKSKLKGKPDISAFHEIEDQRARMQEDADQNQKGMSYSMINLPETPLEKFEREDYEASCPLSVDEHIKNFLVSENPSEEEYSVPLTKLTPQNHLSRPFYLSFGGQTTSFGKPRSISRISSSVVLIGTSYGQICGFDVVKNTLLFKLGDTKESSYGGVTAMDYREEGKYLVAGYENGNLSVYDIVKKSVVKTITSLHEAAIVALKIVMNEPLQYLSVDTSGIVMLNELEKMMMLYNQDNYCIFSKSANLNFLQLEILNHRYNTFTRGNKSGDEEMVIAYAATQQIVVTTLEPISKTKRVILKYPRPPMVYDGAIPHICWYECQAPTRLGPRKNESPLDTLKRLNPETSPGLGKEALEGKYWLLMAWGFCVFIVEMRSFENQTEFEELGYLKFGDELIHIQLIEKQMVLIVDSSLFIHLIHIDDIRNHQDFYLSTGKKKNSPNDEGKIYSERLDFADDGEISFQTSFFFKDMSGKFVKMYQNTINTDKNQKEALIIHSKNIYSLKLNTWRDVLDEIEAQKNWLKLFTVGLALYYNTIKEVYQVSNETERKDQLRDYFKDKLRRFIITQLMGKESASLPNKKHLVEEVTLTLIDFCLETEMEDFLFTDAKQCMATLGFKDIFMKSLEPFIRWNKIHTFPTFDSLKEVISFFYESGKVSITQQLIASLDLDRLGHDERELFMLSLMTMCLETNLFTALLYLCIKGTENFTLPFFTFLKLAFEADMKGKSSEKKKYVLRCLWYIKTIFKRKVVFQEDFIPEEKTKRILRDLIVLFMETSNLKVFCDVDPKLTTVLVGMLFTGEISLFMEDFYGEIQLSGISAKQEELKNNLHFQILNKVVKFYEEYFGISKDKEKRAYIAFIVTKVVENQRHKFLNENLCVDSARYMFKHHNDLDDLIILDYKLSLPSLTQHSVNARKEAILQISEQFLVERKGTMIERLLLYARHLVSSPETVGELIRTCETNTIFAEPLCYLLSLRKEYNTCLSKYLNPLNPKKTKNKALQWVITTMMQLIANKDPTLDQFKAAVFERIDDLVSIDPETTTNIINNYFKDEIKTIINKLSTRPDVQMSFLDKIIHEAKNPHMVDDETIELYIKLLAESNNKAGRKRVLVELKKQGRYPQRCLDICKQNNIKDAWAFLEETRGNYESIKTAIDLRYEMLEDYIRKCLKSKQHRLNAKQDRKIREKFEAVSTTIQNHFIDNNELWFNVLEKILNIDVLITRYNSSKPKQEALKNLFDELSEKRFIDIIIGYVPYDIIITELSKRSARITPFIVRKMLVRMLRDNNYDLRFSEDARTMQKSEVLSYMNVNIIPFEVKGIGLTNRCGSCFKTIDYEPSILFSCGHIYHANEVAKSDEITCELCSNSEIGIVTKIFLSKTKKTTNQPQPQPKVVEEHGYRKMSESDSAPRKNSALNSKVLKSIRFETRFNAIDRAKDKLKQEVNDLVTNYLMS